MNYYNDDLSEKELESAMLTPGAYPQANQQKSFEPWKLLIPGKGIGGFLRWPCTFVIGIVICMFYYPYKLVANILSKGGKIGKKQYDSYKKSKEAKERKEEELLLRPIPQDENEIISMLEEYELIIDSRDWKSQNNIEANQRLVKKYAQMVNKLKAIAPENPQIAQFEHAMNEWQK